MFLLAKHTIVFMFETFHPQSNTDLKASLGRMHDNFCLTKFKFRMGGKGIHYV